MVVGNFWSRSAAVLPVGLKASSAACGASPVSIPIASFPLTNLVGTLHFPNMAPAPPESAQIEEARKLGKTDPLKAEAIYKEILSKKPGASEAALREYESALMGLGESYKDTRKTDDLAELVRSSTSSLSSFTKAKTAKLGIEIQSIQTGCCANKRQSANYSISFPLSQTPLTFKSLSLNHVSNGPSPNAAASCVRTSKLALSHSICKSNHTTTPSH